MIMAALVLGLAGCSSAASTTAQSASTPVSTAAGAASSAPDTAGDTSADVAGSTSSDAAAATSATSAAGPSRPADACTMLSSDQVADAVGTPGPYDGSHEDPADDGTPIWGCAWGTQTSDANFMAIPASSFQFTPDPANGTVTPVSGIGDQARLIAMKPDGRNPELQFAIGGGYYDLTVTVDRSEIDATNVGQEKSAEQTLAKLLLAKLSS